MPLMSPQQKLQSCSDSSTMRSNQPSFGTCLPRHMLKNLLMVQSRRSSLILLWAVLAVDMVAECINKHTSARAIHEMVARVPKKLGVVYQHVLESIIPGRNKPEDLLLFQWM
ncbi:hypothetical protein BJ875DRAFT_451729 [Amylocarpus encephaloides]|uniref:Uncharacterized protein n=1 Tax=Amylocarpus encephaloides TaxID=45428 RepID=A0A9P7YRA6_9HELO|nr:hypothetical protein BJ875DRAFT_451729 [Amylocarpus encephaloides]